MKREKSETQEFRIRTDLAVEMNEAGIDEKSDPIGEKFHDGIRMEQEKICGGSINVIRVVIENERGAKKMGKPMGTYITLEAESMTDAGEGYHREMSAALASYLGELLPVKRGKRKILVVGLGNREATPDSLGPRVVDQLCVTRLITEETGNPVMLKMCEKYEVSAIIPGVLAQTGMEAAEIVRGIVKEICPDVVVAIDALAARNTKRLNTTIQISDTGIHPGSGVGNHRKGLTKENVNVPVIALGIPTVVDAATIVHDTFENLLNIFQMTKGMEGFSRIMEEFSTEEKYELVKELIDPAIAAMYVTSKDIDAAVRYISYTVSEGLNILWSEHI